jgi:PPOX class probable F420-dependent enzyme
MSSTTLDRTAAGTGARSPFAALRDQSFMSLTTFRKSGAPVVTRVWFADEDGRLYITTASKSGKVKRLRHTARVRVQACSAFGASRGPELEAVARVLPPEEHSRARAMLRRKYGWLFWTFEHCNREAQTYLEVTPSP